MDVFLAVNCKYSFVLLTAAFRDEHNLLFLIYYYIHLFCLGQETVGFARDLEPTMAENVLQPTVSLLSRCCACSVLC